MKIKYYFVSFFMLPFLSCNIFESADQLQLVGNINNKVNGIIELSIDENDVGGIFKNTDTGEEIPLRGTMYQEDLRLEEFAEKNKLTGIFEGKYRNSKYKGYWKRPDKKVKVPFVFTNRSSASSKGKEAIKELLVEWARNETKKLDDLCNPQECKENMTRSKKGLDPVHDCYMEIVSDLSDDKITLGDLNNDGLEDAIVEGNYDECMGGDDIGSAFINIQGNGFKLFFIAQKNGYKIEKLKQRNEYFSNGKLMGIKDGLILLKGNSSSGDPNLLHWETDIEWTAKLEYRNGALEVVSKDEKKKY